MYSGESDSGLSMSERQAVKFGEMERLVGQPEKICHTKIM
jgi:hypothetical protein